MIGSFSLLLLFSMVPAFGILFVIILWAFNAIKYFPKLLHLPKYPFIFFVIFILDVVLVQVLNERPIFPTLKAIIPVTIGFSIYVIVSSVYFDSRSIKFAKLLLLLIVAVQLFTSFVNVTGASDVGAVGTIGNSNAFGSLSFVFMLFAAVLYPRKYFYIIATVLIITIYESKSRAALLTVFYCWGVYSILFSMLKFSTRTVFMLGVGCSIAYGVALILLAEHPLFYSMLDVFSSTYLGKPLDTGRFNLTQTIVLNIDYLYGIGFDDPTRNVLGLEYSAHNLYMHLLLAGGFFSVLFFLFLVYSILIRIENKSLASGLLAFLFLENFQVTLIANYFQIGVLFWFLAGMATNRSISVNDVHVKNKQSLECQTQRNSI